MPGALDRWGVSVRYWNDRRPEKPRQTCQGVSEGMTNRLKKPDIMIVGTGAAGLFCALHTPKETSVLMVTKEQAEESDSFLAQGGISTLKSAEDYESYFEDTMKAGHYENDAKAVEIMIRDSPEIIEDLIRFGVEFEQDGEGVCYTREGGHSENRILYHKDVTGREITSKLLARVRERENVTILEHTALLDLVCAGDPVQCMGGVLRGPDGALQALPAKTVVLATGGIGGLFASSTNFPHITGDGLAIALKHGIALQNIHYIQIHPTVLYSKKPGRRFLISESVRGEGAVLLNPDGERFVDELLPRDVVTQAIRKEMETFHTDHVELSVAHLGVETIRSRFPNIYQKCMEEGYDITKGPVPVAPAQHYFMGGIQVDLQSKSSMDRLYVVGEASCNGVHGSNRLASNSLLESLVFAKRAAVQIGKDLRQESKQPFPLVDLQAYGDIPALHREYRRVVLEEIKRKDRDFYDKWCNHET